MELTNLFLNQLTGKNNNDTKSNAVKVNKEFGKILNKVENNRKSKEVFNKTDYSKKDEYTKKYNQENNKISETNKVSENKKIKPDKEIIKKDNFEEKEKVIAVDNKILEDLSNILNVPKEDIMQVLSSLSMSISMLQDAENLSQFLQAVLDVKPVDLLSIDNIRDIMKEITEMAKSIDYKDIMTFDENFKDTLNNLIQDNKQITILESSYNQNTDIRQKIDNLLSELNGEIITSKINIDDVELGKENGVVDIKSIKEVKFDTEKFAFSQNENQFNDNKNQFLDESENKGILGITELNNNNNKVFNLSLPKTQVFKNINSTEIISQIMDKIKVSVKSDVSEIKMLLKPEQLGEVSLKIATQNGIVTAQFIAESQKVKEIIEANFNQLKDILSEQGINVGSLEVNVSDNGNNEQKFNMFEQNNNKSKNIFKEEFETENQDEKIDNEVKGDILIDSSVSYSI